MFDLGSERPSAPKLAQADSRRQHLVRLLPYLGRCRRTILIGAMALLLANLAAVASPWILRSAIDDLSSGGTQRSLLAYALMMVGVRLLEGGFRFQMRRSLFGVSRHVECDLRNDLFAHLQSLPLGFHERSSTGDLLSRATNDLHAVQMLAGPGLMSLMNTLFLFLLTAPALVSIDLYLALLILLPFTLLGFCFLQFSKRVYRHYSDVQEQLGMISGLTREAVAAMRVVKAYGQQEGLVGGFRRACREYVGKGLALARTLSLFTPLLILVLGLSTVALLWYGGLEVMRGNLTLGDLVAVLAYLAILTRPTAALGWVMNVMERGAAAMGRVVDVLDTLPEIQDESPKAASELTGIVKAAGLSFSLAGRRILSDVDLEARPGRIVAIVGKAGSGKSMLLKLLCRLYPVSRGSITLDGVDLNDIPLRTLRKSIGYVPQEIFLFSETVRENIAFGDPDAAIEDIWAAAEISQLRHDIEDFEAGMETLVGERGAALSGGQRQRMAISRALLVHPKIVLMDEAFSSVDSRTEERILERLLPHVANKTLILASHRVSSVKMADTILLLEAGRVREQGTHEELLKAGGRYASLYAQQLLAEELEQG